MFGFLAEAEVCIGDEFREANVSPAEGLLPFVIRCNEKMPKGTRIWCVRSDSAGYQAGLINWCREKEIHFCITADLDKAVKEVM